MSFQADGEAAAQKEVSKGRRYRSRSGKFRQVQAVISKEMESNLVELSAPATVLSRDLVEGIYVSFL